MEVEILGFSTLQGCRNATAQVMVTENKSPRGEKAMNDYKVISLIYKKLRNVDIKTLRNVIFFVFLQVILMNGYRLLVMGY